MSEVSASFTAQARITICPDPASPEPSVAPFYLWLTISRYPSKRLDISYHVMDVNLSDSQVFAAIRKKAEAKNSRDVLIVNTGIRFFSPMEAADFVNNEPIVYGVDA